MPSANIRRKEIQQYHKAQLIVYKGGKCVDCGLTGIPVVGMEFDHRNPAEKIFDISTGLGEHLPMWRLKLEVDKCDLVCSICHAIRTTSRIWQIAGEIRPLHSVRRGRPIKNFFPDGISSLPMTEVSPSLNSKIRNYIRTSHARRKLNRQRTIWSEEQEEQCPVVSSTAA